VGIVNRLLAGRSGFESRMRQKSCIFFKPSIPGGTPNLIFTEYWDFFPEVKRPGRQFDHLLVSSAEVNTAWSYNARALYAYISWPKTDLP
jgi:hypothetical protein